MTILWEWTLRLIEAPVCPRPRDFRGIRKMDIVVSLVSLRNVVRNENTSAGTQASRAR